LPAIGILGRIQASAAAAGDKRNGIPPESRFSEAMRRLRRRHEYPDLIIAGSLDANPSWNDIGPFDSILRVYARAKLLSANVKIRDFQLAAFRVHGQIEKLTNTPSWKPGLNHSFVDSIVDAAVLPIFPTDREHLNPTFAFCRSLNLRPDRVLSSVADGCYQTLCALADASVRVPAAPVASEEDLSAQSVRQLVSLGRMSSVQRAQTAVNARASDGKCPFFRLNNQGFLCPFHSYSGSEHLVKIARTTYVSCCRDSAH